MSATEEFCSLVAEIDQLLRDYDPGKLDPDRVVGDIFAERARQAPLLLRAVELACDGLKRFPLHPELLRRRAWAYSHIVTAAAEYTHLELAEEDLRRLLAACPNELAGGYELLELQFTFSAMEDRQVAELAGSFAERAEALLLDLRALQIRALSYADDRAAAERLFQEWTRRFPAANGLRMALEDFTSKTEQGQES